MVRSTSCNITSPPVFILGIDMGTSGIRGVVVKKTFHHHLPHFQICLSESIPFSSTLTQHTEQSPQEWTALLDQLLKKLACSFTLNKIKHLIIDATSSTVLLCDPSGTPLTQALMYHNQSAIKEAKSIQNCQGFSPNTPVQGATSTLAKVLFLTQRLSQKQLAIPPVICHQVDFLNHYLCHQINITDENNALKLGYDSQTQNWPDWVRQKLAPLSPPKVVTPGTPLGYILPQRAKQYGFAPSLMIHAGTTDSIAGFLASGASKTGDAVISLGSTLAIKMVTSTPIFNSKYGIYSHKLKQNWLIGGASNSGGAVLRNAYSLTEIEYLNQTLTDISLDKLDITTHYYPLNFTGERFPISDPCLNPVMPDQPSFPLPIDSTTPSNQALLNAHQIYYLNLIKGLVHIEDLAYQKLFQETQQPIKRLYTVGGGVKNSLWQQCRIRHFQEQKQTYFASPIILKTATSLDAAYGVTQLI